MSTNGRRAWRKWATRRRRLFRRLCRDLRSGAHTKVTPTPYDAPIKRRVRKSSEGRGLRGPRATPPRPFTPRSLVGMTMGARKRRWATDYDALPQSARAETMSMLRAYGVYPKEGNPLAQKLRPCPGCCACWGADVSPADFGYYAECFGPRVNGHTKREIFRMWKWQRNLVDDCDGSGVLPARRSK